MLLLDVDGVLTDGTFEPKGTEEVKRFHSRDGIGLTLAKRAGLKLGLISGRVSSVVRDRARELGMHFVRLGVEEKLPVFLEAIAQEGLTPDAIAYMGDDLTDLPVLTRVGFPRQYRTLTMRSEPVSITSRGLAAASAPFVSSSTKSCWQKGFTRSSFRNS